MKISQKLKDYVAFFFAFVLFFALLPWYGVWLFIAKLVDKEICPNTLRTGSKILLREKHES